MVTHTTTEYEGSFAELLSNGGRVLVVGSYEKSWEPFRGDPRFVFWSGKRSDINRHLHNGNNLPGNTRLVILSRFLNHTQANKIRAEARRKNIILVSQKADGEIARILTEFTPKEIVVTATGPTADVHASSASMTLSKPPNGYLLSFVQQHLDPTNRPTREGLRLLDMVRSAGYEVTANSMHRTVSEIRRRLGVTKPRK